MDDMTAVFKQMGVWMDWDNPYMSISRDYMEGEWWLVKRAHELGRLYEGERTITWDSVNGTALAKHELVRFAYSFCFIVSLLIYGSCSIDSTTKS
jgi:isoleucyl-tRNA synthetase